MLTATEQKWTNRIFWALFLLSAVCTVGGYVAAAALVVYAVQAAVMYVRLAKEDWQYTPGLRAGFVNTQRYYRLYLRRIFTPSYGDEDQQYLDAYGGGMPLRQRLWEWCKRILRGLAAGLMWLPAMAVHACFLCAALPFRRGG